MRVLVLFQHYHTPDCATAYRPYSLVERLAESFDVTLIAGNAERKRRLTYSTPWVPDGVRYIEIDVAYSNEMASARRVLAFAKYAAETCLRGGITKTPDVIFGSSTPLSVGCAALLLAQRFRKPWIFEVRDLWPAFPIQMGVIPEGMAANAFRSMERSLYDNAAHVITASPDMAAHVNRRTKTCVTTIPYGTDINVADQIKPLQEELRAAYVPGDGHIISYVGRFGRANDIPTVLRTIERLSHRNDITFLLAGEGHHESEIREFATRRSRVHPLPTQPYRRALALLRASSLSLVPFIDLPVLSTNAPSKLFDSLSVGTPAIVTNPGWTARLVRDNSCGWAVPPEDPDALALQIARALEDESDLQKRSSNARRYASQHLNRRFHLERIVKIFNQVGRANS